MKGEEREMEGELEEKGREIYGGRGGREREMEGEEEKGRERRMRRRGRERMFVCECMM